MCIFCQISQHEIPANIIYEDSNFIAILDISQATKGHTLVMPKVHFDNLLEVPAEISNQLLEVTNSVASLLILKLSVLGCNILSNINEVAGQTIRHCHIHIIPRYQDDDLEINFKPHDYDLKEILNEIIK